MSERSSGTYCSNPFLIVGQNNLVGFEGGLVHQAARQNIHHVQGIVLQEVSRVRGHGLVVLIHRVEGRMRVLGHKGGRAHQDKAAVLGEERTLAVQLLVAGRHRDGEAQLEEAVEHTVSNSKGKNYHYFCCFNNIADPGILSTSVVDPDPHGSVFV